MRTSLVHVVGDAGRESCTTADPEYELIVTLRGRQYRDGRKNKKSRKK